MALLTWNDRYSVGVEAVDHEHRELIDLINALHAAIGTGEAEDTEAQFGDLLRAIAAHFALEEKLMREHRYSDYGTHKADHEVLLDEIRDMMDGDAPSDSELARRLDAWFTRHFATHDAKLHRRLGPGHG